MLRWLLAVLVVCNFVAFALASGLLASVPAAGAREPERLDRQVHPERLKIQAIALAAEPAAAPASAAETAATSAAAPASRPASASTAPTASTAAAAQAAPSASGAPAASGAQ